MRRHGDDDGGMSSMSSMSSSSMSDMHGGMHMDHGDCKVSMLWNWYTIDACFLSTSWHIRNNGMFAASCIGIALLVVCLEGLRRLSIEFDSSMHQQWRAHAASVAAAQRAAQVNSDAPNLYRSSSVSRDAGGGCEAGCVGAPSAFAGASSITYRPTPLQQLIRAVLHAVVFGLAYILMLLAMYYNGYIIISIILGAALGKFLCDWRSTTIPVVLGSSLASATSGNGKGDDGSVKSQEQREPTVCCG